MTTIEQRAAGTPFAVLYKQPPAPPPVLTGEAAKKERARLRGVDKRAKARTKKEELRRLVAATERDNKLKSNWALI